MAEQLTFNDKQENNGVNQRGRLTAAEFNQVVNAVNDHTQQLNGVSIKPVEGGADAFNDISIKDSMTLYIILEDQ